MFFGKRIQLGNRDIQQIGHFVNERTCPARTRAVHADIRRRALLKEDHLGVFAADVDQGVYRGEAFNHFGRGDNYLQEGQAAAFADAHAGRAG